MIQKTSPFPDRLSKYLQLGSHEKARQEAQFLWEEALVLLKAANWRSLLTVDEFFDVFHPYAESSQSIRRLLRCAREVWLLAVTAGDGVERRSREYLKKGEAFRGYVLDRMGSFLAEEQIRQVDKIISEESTGKGYKTTRRYSPGYRDFSLEAQVVFVDLASCAIPELRLTSDFLLVPEKSITAIKGVLE